MAKNPTNYKIYIYMRKTFLIPVLFGLFSTLTSCFPAVEEVADEMTSDVSTGKKTTLRLTTRSATGVIEYPVLVLTYDVDGNKSAQQILASADDQVKMNLPAGLYRVSAITGYQSYVEPKDYSSSDAAFSVPSSGFATAPLFVGSADVALADKAATVEVVMSIRSASLDITLKDLPETVNAVNVAVARQYGAYGMDGKYSSSIVARADCQKNEVGAWTTGLMYVLPGADTQTVLTITITDNDQQYSYGYTVNEPLMAAVPYVLTGTYKGGERVEHFDLSGMLTVENWKDPKAIDFEFGEGASADNSATEDQVESVELNAIPTALSVWNGHVVALVMSETDDSADLLLVSLREYTNVYSVKAADHEYDAINIANAYVEGDLSGWHIPTSYEIQKLKAGYKDAYMQYLNDVLVQAGGTEFVQKDAKDNVVRYLCDGGLQAIGFVTGSNIGAAGKTTKYSLRLVKKVHITVK